MQTLHLRCSRLAFQNRPYVSTATSADLTKSINLISFCFILTCSVCPSLWLGLWWTTRQPVTDLLSCFQIMSMSSCILCNPEGTFCNLTVLLFFLIIVKKKCAQRVSSSYRGDGKARHGRPTEMKESPPTVAVIGCAWAKVHGFFLEAVARSHSCWMSVITLGKFHFEHTYRLQQCRVSLCNGQVRKGYVNWTIWHWEQRCLTVNCATCWSIYLEVLMSPNRRGKNPNAKPKELNTLLCFAAIQCTN